MSRFAPAMVAVTAASACLVAAACAKARDHGPAAAAAADCDRLGARSSAQVMAMMPPGTIAEEAGRVIAAHCKADRWSAATVACALAAQDPVKECFGKLTVEQLQRMQVDIQAILAKGAAAMPR